MTLENILANKDFAIAQKKAEIVKRDLRIELRDFANKAYNSAIKEVEVLIYDVEIKKQRNEFMFNQYKNGYVLNHSVGMRYVKIYFCYNTEDAEYSQDKENWNKYYPSLLNPEEADKNGYFWAIVEAKNIEGSAVVKGSNGLTPVLNMEIIDEDTIRVKCAVSPSNFMDSHSDVHIAGLWKKRLNENNYDLFLQEHEMDLKNIIADSINNNLKVYTEMISVKELVSKFGNKNKEFEPSQNTQKEDVPPVTSKNYLYY
jgi:hypothetical protein